MGDSISSRLGWDFQRRWPGEVARDCSGIYHDCIAIVCTVVCEMIRMYSYRVYTRFYIIQLLSLVPAVLSSGPSIA